MIDTSRLAQHSKLLTSEVNLGMPLWSVQANLSTDVWIQWNGMAEWTGMVEEWNDGIEQYFSDLNWWSPLYKDHFLTKTTSL